MLSLIFTCLINAQNYQVPRSGLSSANSSYTYNGSYRRKRNREIRKIKNKFGLESHESYDFNSCSKYNKEDAKENYFVSCQNGQLVEDTDFDKLIGSSQAIETKIYKDNLLNNLKEHTLRELQKNIDNLKQIKSCTGEQANKIELCKSVQPSILKVVQKQLPQLRSTMAMMNEPRKLRRMKTPLYTSQIKHEIPTGDVPPLTLKEREKVKETAQAIKYKFEQDWFASQPESNKCIENISPSTFRFKPSTTRYSCASFQESKLRKDTKNKTKEFRENLKSNYYKMISANPLLAHLPLTGEEDNDQILKDVNSTVSKLIEASDLSLKKVSELKDDELSVLLRKDNIVDSYLTKQGPSEVLCDVTQDLKDDEDFDELKTDLYLAGGALVGGGVCAFTAGIGCVVGVGLVAEGAGILVSQDRLEEAQLSFNSGLTTAKTFEDRKFERDFTLLLAPLSAAGNVIGKGAKYSSKIGAKAYNYAPDGSSFDKDFIGIAQRDKFRSKTNLSQGEIPTNKTAVIAKYENYILTSPKLNARWIDNAKSSNAGLYLDIENAALKRLNDTIGDKSFVTALTNIHKDIVSAKVNKLLEKYPEVDIEVYSDFKSVRYAFVPKDMPEDLKQALMKDLNSTYKEANEEYANLVKSMDGIPKTELPEQWFQGGLGVTADQAGQSAKKARQISRPAQLTSFDEIQSLIEVDTKSITSFSSKLNDGHPLARAGLTENIPGSSSQTVALPVFEVVRKIKSPTRDELKVFKSEYLKETGKEINYEDASALLSSRRLANELNTKFGSELSEQNARELLDYSTKLDSLTPGLWVKERVNANLNDAVNGGMSGDVTGMGARNIRQVAYDIAQTSDKSAAGIVDAARKGEQAVTKTFDDIKNNFKTTVKDVLDKRGIKYSDPCSGDDCVMVPKSKLKESDENALVNAFAKQSNPSQYRLSFIPEGVKGSDRTNLAVHGELVEKELRKRILGVADGKIDHSKLSQLTIATKMPGKINDGGVGLILGVGENANLTSAERKILETQLNSAVKKVNEALAKEAPEKSFNYKAGSINWLD